MTLLENFGKSKNHSIRVAVLLLASIRVVHAGIGIEGPLPAASDDFMFTESAETAILMDQKRDTGAFFFDTQYDYIRRPLIEVDANGNTAPVVSSLNSFHLRPGYLLTPNLLFSFHTAVSSVKLPDGSSKLGMNDSTVQLKYKLNDEGPVVFALIPEATIPTGASNLYLSTGSMSGGLRVAAESQFGNLRTAVNVGYRYQPGAQTGNLDYRNQLILAAAAHYHFTPQWSANAEASGFLSMPFSSVNSPGEYYLGANYQISNSTLINAGASLSGFDQKQNQGMRAILGIKYMASEGKSGEGNFVSRGGSCSSRPFSVTLPSRTLNENEQNLLQEMPYLSDVSIPSKYGKASNVSTLKLGDMTSMTPAGISIVDDGQIPFAVDLAQMPPKSKIKMIKGVYLKMSVTKLAADKFTDTEILCSIENKICSGTPIYQKKWAPMLNPAYFPNGAQATNRYFSKQYLGKKVGRWKKENIYASELTLDMTKVIAGSDTNIVQYLYPTRLKGAAKPTLYFAVADDTFVSNNARIELLMEVEECR